MSSFLWRYYLEDDVDRFRHLLETAAYNVRNVSQKGGAGGTNMGIAAGIGMSSSPAGMLSTSPNMHMKPRKVATPSSTGTTGGGPVPLSRADLNRRDNHGLTILHHAASSTAENAIGFAQALIDHPLTDLYLQDLENGWTALHRAFYAGNITIARAILDRDAENALSGKAMGVSHNALGLIKIKDREGNGPLDLYAATIQDRTLHPEVLGRSRSGSDAGSEMDHYEQMDEEGGQRRYTIGIKDLAGDECFTFGSNRNVTLGFGDEDDRQWPERVTLRRPDHLLQRFYREHLEQHDKIWSDYDSSRIEIATATLKPTLSINSLPWVIRSKPLVIQDVHMARLQTAVLTTDPESNLYMCGHGPGGRLGLGHERTQFTLTCVEGGAIAGKRIATVALGHNHTLAISDEGETFSWGSNGFGQLGYALPKTGPIDDDPVQNLPRQIFGPLKRETVIGLAASRIHSVAYTSSALYCWGKNEGQLGLVDSDARSLDVQVIPRRVAASLFSSPISSVSAIDRATICLLSSTHEVWVFANYGYAKIQFPLDGSGFSNYFLKQSFMVTDYDRSANHIVKVTSGGDTICAMSKRGELFALSVGQPQATSNATTSTTNPTKIKGALSYPHLIWSLKKNNMAARDIGVDADGSIIITTEEGSVWKRSRRAKIKDASASGTTEYKPKDYKFSRISGLTRVIAVRSSGYGAYAAIRRDCNVTKTQIAVEERSIWKDIFPLLCFQDLRPSAMTPDSELEEPEPRFWQGRKQPDELSLLRKQLLESKDLEKELKDHLRHTSSGDHDIYVKTTVSNLCLPVHQVLLAARSRTFREGFQALCEGDEFTIPDFLTIQKDDKGVLNLSFQGMDPLTLVNLVLYLYTDSIVDYWHHTRRAPQLAHRYRTVRAELMKAASHLKMHKLEPAVRQMVEPTRSLHMDMEVAFKEPSFFGNSDVVVQLADEDVPMHSTLVCQRCPFFEGLFMGRAGGRWLAERRNQLSSNGEAINIDLKHIESSIFRLVLRHIYTDAGEEIFNNIVSADLDEFLDLVMDVMSVANELMLDRLAQICQKAIGRYVNVRNVGGLLNAIAPSSVKEFKDASLEYMCLSLEGMLHGRYLDELDEDLLLELDEIVRANQLACMPFAKSGRAEAQLLEDHPELPALLERERQAKLDAFTIRAKYQDNDHWTSGSFRGNSFDDFHSSPLQQKTRRRSSNHGPQSRTSPALKGKEAVINLGSSINEDGIFDLGVPALRTEKPDNEDSRQEEAISSSPADGWLGSRGKHLSSANGTPSERKASPLAGAPSPVFSASPSTPSRNNATPWAATPTPGPKIEIKDILSQATSSRVSNLSLGLAAARSKSDFTTSGTGTKLSQKERKKLQQQQAQQAMASDAAVSSGNESPSLKGSPWQQVTSSQRIPSLQDVMGGQRQPSPQPPRPERSRTPTTPQLTMRQTVANSRPLNGSPLPTKSEMQHPVPQRSVSTPHAAKPSPRITPDARPQPFLHQGQRLPPTPSASASRPARAPSPTSFPPITSIRHQPRPVEPSLQLSMSDILSMQQAEKDVIKEAAAKRSLQDIQTEQEFMEWWAKEEARLKGAEDEGVDGDGSRGRRGGEGGGKRGGRRGGRRGGASAGEAKRGGSVAANAGRRDSARAAEKAAAEGPHPIPNGRGGNRGGGEGSKRRGK